MCIRRNIEARSSGHIVSVWKPLSISYSGCVFVAFSFLHLMIMRLISSVARLALPYFHTSSHKMHDFPKKKGFLAIKCVLWSSLQRCSEKFLILRELNGVWSKMFIVLHVIYRYSFHMLMKLEFYRLIFEKESNIKFHVSSSGNSGSSIRTD